MDKCPLSLLFSLHLMQPANEYESLWNFSPWAWSTISTWDLVSHSFVVTFLKSCKFYWTLPNFLHGSNVHCSLFLWRNFMWNELTGSIPKEIGHVASLRLLWVLTSNALCMVTSIIFSFVYALSLDAGECNLLFIQFGLASRNFGSRQQQTKLCSEDWKFQFQFGWFDLALHRWNICSH